MSLFSIIAEAKIQDWFKKKSSGEIKETQTIESIDQAKSAETYMLEDILVLIERAKNEKNEERNVTLKKTKEMEIQLLATLEKDGYHLMAQMTAQTIREHRIKNRPQSVESLQ